MGFSSFSSIDTQIFLLINHLPHTPVTDFVFSLISAAGYWGIGWLLVGILWVLWQERRDKRTIVTLMIAIFICVVLVDSLKWEIGRLRPIFTVAGTIEVAGKTETYSFPSGHTAIAVAAAYILRRARKPMPTVIWVAAALVAFSRMYLGKHFPSDIVGGAVVGLVVAFFCLMGNRTIPTD